MAGKGIKYSWGCAKNACRSKPIGEMRGENIYQIQLDHAFCEM